MAKVMTTLLLATLLTGIVGCKDELSEIQPPDPEPRSARSGEGSPPRPIQQQVPEVAPGSYLEGHEYPWSQPLDECMAASGLRTECIEKLPPDILARFEAWEAKRATVRQRRFQQRRQPENLPSFGVERDDPNAGT